MKMDKWSILLSLVCGCTSLFYIEPSAVPAEEVTRSYPAPVGKEFELADGVVLEMIGIGHGTFVQGLQHEVAHSDCIYLARKVTLTDDFWLGRYELTRAQYLAVMGKMPEPRLGDHFPGVMMSDDCPMCDMTWKECMEFCNALNARFKDKLPNGYSFTLPTEAQWEYACRAGTIGAFHDGSPLPVREVRDPILGEYYARVDKCDAINDLGWYEYNSQSIIHPVGEKNPNAWGLFDMHGNVSEWVLDMYNTKKLAKEFESHQNVIDPYNIKPCGSAEVYRDNHLIKGGCWKSSAADVAAWAYRSSQDCHTVNGRTCYFGNGMRVAISKKMIERDDVDNRSFGVSRFAVSLRRKSMIQNWLIIGEVLLDSADEIIGVAEQLNSIKQRNCSTINGGSGSGYYTIKGPETINEGQSARYALYVGGKKITSGVSWSGGSSLIVSGGNGNVMAGNPPKTGGKYRTTVTAHYGGKSYSKSIYIVKTGMSKSIYRNKAH